MTQAGRELAVGSVIVAAVIVVAVGTLWLKGTEFGKEETHLEVLVQEVGQLSQGNAVKLRGVPIGTVSDVQVEPGGALVRVGMDITGDFRIDDPQAVGVVIAPESLFGDWQAEIVDRSRFAYPFYRVPASEMTRDTLVLGGYAIADISRLTAAADEISQNLQRLTNRVDSAFTPETARSIRQAIEDIGKMSSEIRTMIEQQAQTFQSVSGDVARAATEISAASTQARSTLQEVDAMITRGEIDSALVSLRNTARNVDRMSAEVRASTAALPGTMARADSAFASVQRLTGRIESGQGSLGRLIVDTTLAFRAERAMAQLDSLLADVKRNPRRYVRLSIF